MKKTSRHTIEECYYLGMNIKKIIDNSERNRLAQIKQIEARLFEAIAKKESHLVINELKLTYSKFLLI